MFPELSKMIHDYIRPKTRGDWRTIHKYIDSDFKQALVRNHCARPLLNRADGGFVTRFKQLKNLEYQGYNYTILKVTDNVIVLRYYFVKYYYVYTCGGLFKGHIYYRKVDQILFLAEKQYYYFYFELLFIGIVIAYLFSEDHFIITH